MIPLTGESVVLPRMEQTGLKQTMGLTIVQPPNQLTTITNNATIKDSISTINNSFSPGIRILHSRNQHRKNSVSSICSLLNFEDEQFRKLSSGRSSVDELRLCLETRRLSLENTSNAKTNSDKNNENQTRTDCSRGVDVSMATSVVSNEEKNCNEKNDGPKKSKIARIKSHKRKNKKRLKKQAKKKGPNVFERLAVVQKNSASQDKLATSSSTSIKKTNTVFYKRSSGNILEIKRLHAAYMPVNNQQKTRLICLPKVPISNDGDCQSTRQLSCHSIPTVNHKLETISPRKSLDAILRHDNFGTRKVYLSEVQSQMIGGVPGAPPATPFPDEQARIEYIPCMTDIKSQRAVKSKLEKIVTKLKSDEKQRKENEMKKNQKRLKESLLKLKQQQRAEIYALNKVMTELENQNFRRFMLKQEAVSSMGV